MTQSAAGIFVLQVPSSMNIDKNQRGREEREREREGRGERGRGREREHLGSREDVLVHLM
jgi:hypothetical protein